MDSRTSVVAITSPAMLPSIELQAGQERAPAGAAAVALVAQVANIPFSSSKRMQPGANYQTLLLRLLLLLPSSHVPLRV